MSEDLSKANHNTCFHLWALLDVGKAIYVDTNVIVRCLREDKNIEYTYNWILETEYMSFRFVSEKIAGWESLAQYIVMQLILVTGIKPTVPLSAIDKENLLESSLHWSVYLYIIHLVCALIILHSQPNYVWHDLWHDLWYDLITHYVIWCDKVSHAINSKVK